MEGKGTLRFLTFITIAIFIMALVLFFKKPEPVDVGLSYTEVEYLVESMKDDIESGILEVKNGEYYLMVEEDSYGYPLYDENWNFIPLAEDSTSEGILITNFDIVVIYS